MSGVPPAEFKPLASTLKCTVYGAFGGDETWANVIHVRKTNLDEPGETSAAAVSSALNQFYAGHRANKTPLWTALGVRIRSMQAEDRPTFHYPWAGIVGQGTTEPLPPQVALVLTLKHQSGVLRPRYGRMFLNGYCETHNDANGRPSVATQTEVRLAGDTLMSALVAAGLQLVIASRTIEDEPNPPFYAVWPVTDLSTDDVWDTQRSRARQRGRTRTT